MNIFKKASQLRKQHPRKYSDYQDYVKEARRLLHGKGQPKKAASKSSKKRPAKKRTPTATVGALSFAQARSRYKKQLEEKLAWQLLARDQAKNKTERKKKGRTVTELRRELNNLK